MNLKPVRSGSYCNLEFRDMNTAREVFVFYWNVYTFVLYAYLPITGTLIYSGNSDSDSTLFQLMLIHMFTSYMLLTIKPINLKFHIIHSWEGVWLRYRFYLPDNWTRWLSCLSNDRTNWIYPVHYLSWQRQLFMILLIRWQVATTDFTILLNNVSSPIIIAVFLETWVR